MNLLRFGLFYDFLHLNDINKMDLWSYIILNCVAEIITLFKPKKIWLLTVYKYNKYFEYKISNVQSITIKNLHQVRVTHQVFSFSLKKMLPQKFSSLKPN